MADLEAFESRDALAILSRGRRSVPVKTGARCLQMTDERLKEPCNQQLTHIRAGSWVCASLDRSRRGGNRSPHQH
jgi:hypothetical protein